MRRAKLYYLRGRVGKRTRLHELVVFFSVLGGLQVFGMLGIIAGPVTVVVTIAMLEALFEGGEEGAGK